MAARLRQAAAAAVVAGRNHAPADRHGLELLSARAAGHHRDLCTHLGHGVAAGRHYYNFTAPKFNHDVIQLPFWALATFALYRALRTGRLWFWVLTGFALGMAFWAKYFVPLLALPMALFVLAEPTARRVLATPGPYVAIAVGLLVVSPHLAWLITHDFLPLQYVDV